MREQLTREKEMREHAQREEQAVRGRLSAEAAKKQQATTTDAATMTTTSTADATSQTTAHAVSIQSATPIQSVVSAESTASLATPHASAKVKVSDNQPSTVIAVPSALSPTSPTSSSPAGPPAPLWVLPHPTFAVSAKDQELLRAMFAFLTHQWTMALLLVVSNSRVKKTVEWIKDKQSNECLSCHSEFGLFTRRHHCRLCGGLYCSDCSNQNVDLTKFKLDSVRVCTPCFQVVGVMTHGESLIVHRTKVNQRIKAGDKKKGKTSKEVESVGAVSASGRPTVNTSSSLNTTPRVSAAAGTAPLSGRPSSAASVSSGRPVADADLQIVSGTPRLKKVKSIAAVAQPPTEPTTQPVRTALDVTPRGTVNPIVAPNSRNAAAPAAVRAIGPAAPIAPSVDAAAAAATSQPVSVSLVSQTIAVSDESGVQPTIVRKKVVRKVKRVVPVV